jgi:hypothetical protein
VADNFPLTPGSGRNAATDQVTYSGDTSDVQIVRIAQVTGSEGSKTVVDLPGDATNGLDVDVTRLPALVAGSANIGDVDVLTLPGTAAEAAALPSVFVVVAGDDGTDTQPIQLNAAGDVKVTLDSEAVVLGAGTAEIGKLAAGTANIGDVDVLTLPALVAGTANIGDVDVLTVPEVAGAAASTMNATSGDGSTALTNSAQVIKGAAGKLMGYFCYNPNSSTAYVVFYNTAAASVTVGTTNPLFVLPIPPTSAANLWMQPGGVTFGTAMSWAAATTAAGNGAPSTALDCVAWYV